MPNEQDYIELIEALIAKYDAKFHDLSLNPVERAMASEYHEALNYALSKVQKG